MRIVAPSFEIIEDQLERLTILERIEQCGRICYKSEDRITPDSALPFCRKIVDAGHRAVLEMAVVHLVVPGNKRAFEGEKFLHVSDNGRLDVYVSGSIRAFMESKNEAVEYLKQSILAERFPLFFGERKEPNVLGARFAAPEEIPDSHRHVAVKFIVNRAVSHELVRHRPCSFLQESQRYCRYMDQVTFIQPEWWDASKRSSIGSPEDDWETHMRACESRYRDFLGRGQTPQQARSVLPNSAKTEIIVYADLPEWKHIFALRDHPAADPEMRRVMAPLHREFRARWPDFFTG